MLCSKCNLENIETAKFCIECGTPFRNRCPKCGAENLARAKFCVECGVRLGAAAAAVERSEHPSVRTADTSAPESLEGERKTVTALFADIKGSTELMEDLDPEDARRVIDPRSS